MGQQKETRETLSSVDLCSNNILHPDESFSIQGDEAQGKGPERQRQLTHVFVDDQHRGGTKSHRSEKVSLF